LIAGEEHSVVAVLQPEAWADCGLRVVRHLDAIVAGRERRIVGASDVRLSRLPVDVYVSRRRA
jgi:hypothetical protein